jgi:hypothetical protein
MPSGQFERASGFHVAIGARSAEDAKIRLSHVWSVRLGGFVLRKTGPLSRLLGNFDGKMFPSYVLLLTGKCSRHT